MKRFFKNKRGSLYFCDDGYTDNELNIRICDSHNCDWTMITKKALFEFAEKLKSRDYLIETRRSNYEARPYFAAEIQENGYLFKIKGCIDMSIDLTFKHVDEITAYLLSINTNIE